MNKQRVSSEAAEATPIDVETLPSSTVTLGSEETPASDVPSVVGTSSVLWKWASLILALAKSWKVSLQCQLPSAVGIACVSTLERSTDPPELEILDLEFLLEQFQMGKQYQVSTIDCKSMTHTEINGSWVGQHPLVVNFCKEYSMTPSPLLVTWDVDMVLPYLIKGSASATVPWHSTLSKSWHTTILCDIVWQFPLHYCSSKWESNMKSTQSTVNLWPTQR